MLETSSIFFIALLLGFKHALEPDHLIAVSAIIYKNKNPFKSASIGFLWGIGHTLTIFIVGFFMIIYKLSISVHLADLLERGVGVVIIILGVKTLILYKNVHSHNNNHSHPSSGDTNNNIIDKLKPIFIGFIQGLAGSAGMVILTMSTVNTTFQGLLFILIFGLGTIISMFLYTMVIGYSINQVNSQKFQIKLNLFVGILSTVFGVYYVLI